MSRVGVDGYSWRHTLSYGAAYFQGQKEYLANLFLHTSGLDSFVRHMMEINFSQLKACILTCSGSETLDKKTEMCIRLYCLGTVNLTCEWILGQWRAEPEVLAEVF